MGRKHRCYNHSVRKVSLGRSLKMPIKRPATACRHLFCTFFALFFLLITALRPALGVDKTGEFALQPGSAADFCVTGDGTIVVSNLTSRHVDIYSPSGVYLRSVRPPVDAGDFFSPGAAAAEGENGFWIIDNFSGVAMRYLTDGNLLSSFKLDADGTLLSAVTAIAILPPEKAPELAVTAATDDSLSPEIITVAQPESDLDHLTEEALAFKEGRLFAQRPDGMVSVFSLSGKWRYDLPAPENSVVFTPSGLYLDYPLLWSLDYETRLVSIYDLDMPDNHPGAVPVEGIPEHSPICGLAGLLDENLLIITGGPVPVWMESDDGWKALLERETYGSQPPVVRASGNMLYILDRDSGMIETYTIGTGIVDGEAY